MPLSFPPFYAETGPGWRLAGSLIQLATEIHAADPAFTCLGTIGNAEHAAQGTASDHNPFIVGPDGLGIVRAIDIGGTDAQLRELRKILWNAYAETDNRLYEFGYIKGCSDNLINDWGLPFGTHIDTGDAGHLHISVTQRDGNNPSAAGYVAAIDDRRTWNIGAGVITGQGGGTPVPAPAPVPAGPKLHQGAAWPGPGLSFGPGDYFGPIDGPARSHGGYYPNEQPYIQILQQRLIVCGFVAGHSNPYDGWADGIYDIKGGGLNGPTSQAVTAFQHAHMPGTEFYGQCWSDDWHTLFNLQ